MELRNIVNLVLICVCNLFSGLSNALLAPFYPTEALSKGVSVAESGIVFGSVFLTICIITPICGRYNHIGGGPKMFLLVGSFVVALGNIVFGLLDHLNDRTVFYVLSIVMRIIIALGEAGIGSSSFTLAAKQGTKENQAKLISAVEMCQGVGSMFGSSVGGFLYEVGGFSTPFFVCGGIFLVNCVAGVLFFKDCAESQYENLDVNRVGWFQLLCVPAVPISLLSLMMAGCSFSWYSSSLAPFLSAEYGLTASECGLILMIVGTVYLIFTPVFGYLMDHGLGGLATLVLGNFFITVAFIFIGPIHLFKTISGNLWLTGLAMGVQGFGTAATFLGSMVYMLKSATQEGLPETIQTQGMLSSLWLVAECLGGFLGSTLGGLTYDKVGFEYSTAIEAILVAVSVFVLLFVVVWRYCTNNKKEVDMLKKDEKEMLLRKSEK